MPVKLKSCQFEHVGYTNSLNELSRMPFMQKMKPCEFHLAGFLWIFFWCSTDSRAACQGELYFIDDRVRPSLIEVFVLLFI